MNGIQEASGSIPLSSTKNKREEFLSAPSLLVRLKLQKRSALKIVSQIYPASEENRGCETPITNYKSFASFLILILFSLIMAILLPSSHARIASSLLMEANIFL